MAPKFSKPLPPGSFSASSSSAAPLRAAEPLPVCPPHLRDAPPGQSVERLAWAVRYWREKMSMESDDDGEERTEYGGSSSSSAPPSGCPPSSSARPFYEFFVSVPSLGTFIPAIAGLEDQSDSVLPSGAMLIRENRVFSLAASFRCPPGTHLSLQTSQGAEARSEAACCLRPSF